MSMFNSYISLPEGTSIISNILQSSTYYMSSPSGNEKERSKSMSHDRPIFEIPFLLMKSDEN